MPELPEVETIVRLLERGAGSKDDSLVGCQIHAAHVLWPRTLAEPSLQEFNQRIVGQTIRALSRRGKFLVFTLTEDTLLVHLRMSGDMRVEAVLDQDGKEIPFRKHDRLVLEFTNGKRLMFNDTRKFGRAWLVKNPQTILADLGPEPLDPKLDAAAFYQMLNNRSRQMKPLLMDQSFLAGLGNIYTDEALHTAKIHPQQRSDKLSQADAARLLEAIRGVLTEGIHRNGASIDWVYRGGDFQNYFRVYGRTGEACPECGAVIQRLVVGQRGTHICPQCQPKPE